MRRVVVVVVVVLVVVVVVDFVVCLSRGKMSGSRGQFTSSELSSQSRCLSHLWFSGIHSPLLMHFHSDGEH